LDVTTTALFSPDGKFALSASFDNTLKLWDLASGRELRSFAGHTDYVHSVAFSPDGTLALSGSSDKTLKLWDIATGRELRSFVGHIDQVYSVAFSPDGKFALSGSRDQMLKLWDIATGRTLKSFIGQAGAKFGSTNRLSLVWRTATCANCPIESSHLLVTKPSLLP